LKILLRKPLKAAKELIMAEHCTEPIIWKIIRTTSTTKMVLRKPNSEFIDFIASIFVVKLYFEKTDLRKAQKYLGGRLLSVCTAMKVNVQQICIAEHCQYSAVISKFYGPRGSATAGWTCLQSIYEY
jgi:hypothetical protein